MINSSNCKVCSEAFFLPFSGLPTDYVVTFGLSDAFGTSEYALLEGKQIPNLTQVFLYLDPVLIRLLTSVSWCDSADILLLDEYG